MTERFLTFDVKLPPDIKWIAQDASGAWYGFDREPVMSQDLQLWSLVGFDGGFYKLAAGFPPEDFTQELYEVTR